MVQNPFNGIERALLQTSLDNQIPEIGIHSMELKGAYIQLLKPSSVPEESIQWN